MKIFKKMCLTFTLLLGLAGFPATGFAGGIPVVDGASIQVEIMNVFKQLEEYALQLEQYAVQIDQYSLQADQYSDQLKQSLAPITYIWDQIEEKTAELEKLQARLSSLYEQSTGFDTYLGELKDINSWKGSGLNPLDHTDEVFSYFENINNAEFAANLDLMSTSKYYLDNSIGDASQIAKLQQSAASAQGRMAAIQASNQFLAHQNQQLLEIKNLLAIQANAMAHNFNKQQQGEAAEIAQRRSMYENWEEHKEKVVDYSIKAPNN